MINTFIIYKWFAAILVVLVVVIVSLGVFFRYTITNVRQQVVEIPLSKEYLGKRSALNNELDSYGALGDRKVRIPISAAMERVAAKYTEGTALSAQLPQGHVPVR